MTEPTHHTTYNGPVFNQHGGTNVGINHGYVGVPQDPELRAAVTELAGQLQELRARLTPDQDRVVEEALPVLALGREAMAQRRVTLERLDRIVATAGPVAQSFSEALGRLLGLLG
ncbi:hypothetical protein [Streptomyces sp. SID14515]|uniref:hypothetical protein n=1 Tax=Streptomyces sp. SID14515 TaxID=2706074 RepID=UPI0013C551FC|nr:hypothetical protein [Streptomyces sp. SID14515]NEB40229.1 hypothetical protein [Streptomyces sp. SID14515]